MTLGKTVAALGSTDVVAESVTLFAGIITAGEGDPMFCEESTLALAATLRDAATIAVGFAVTVAGLETTAAGQELAIGDDKILAVRGADK